MMHEDVLSGFLGNEAETSLIVEPFNFSTGHNLFLPWLSTARSRTRRLPFQARQQEWLPTPYLPRPARTLETGPSAVKCNFSVNYALLSRPGNPPWSLHRRLVQRCRCSQR